MGEEKQSVKRPKPPPVDATPSQRLKTHLYHAQAKVMNSLFTK